MLSVRNVYKQCNFHVSQISQYFKNEIARRNLSGSPNEINHELKKKFYEPKVQQLLKQLTRVQFDKVFRRRNLEKKSRPPQYKFLTSKQVEEEMERAAKRAETRVQMPPVVPPREEIDEVLTVDKKIVGLETSNCNYIFTDISFGKTDRNRVIVVREPNGTLRKAKWDERHRMNQIYFPVVGRKMFTPKLFKPEELLGLCERGEYVFVLDLACLQFEPDDPEYQRVTATVYDHVDETQNHETLRSTRHYGPFIFHLVSQRDIDNVIIENLKTDRLEDAVWAINLLHFVKPDCKSANTSYVAGQELMLIKSYIEHDSKKRGVLEMTVKSYIDSKESVSVPKQVN